MSQEEFCDYCVGEALRAAVESCEAFGAINRTVKHVVEALDRHCSLEFRVTKLSDERQSVGLKLIVAKDGGVKARLKPVRRFRVVVGVVDEEDEEAPPGLEVDATLDDQWSASEDLRRIARFAEHLFERVSPCLDCGVPTTTRRGLCVGCLCRTRKRDLEREPPSADCDVCCGICQEAADVPALRRETPCCRKKLHKRCQMELVLKNRKTSLRRLPCPYCRSLKFPNTAFALDDADDYPVDDDDDDDDDPYESDDDDEDE